MLTPTKGRQLTIPENRPLLTLCTGATMKYDNRLEIRLSTKQKEQLYQIAGNNCTVSELIRSRLLTEPSRLELKRNDEISNQLSRMGNNLNQIARVLNSTSLSKMPIPATEVIELKAELQLAINKISDLQITLKR